MHKILKFYQQNPAAPYKATSEPVAKGNVCLSLYIDISICSLAITLSRTLKQLKKYTEELKAGHIKHSALLYS